jgi:PAS domain S-box-containing protein
LGATEISGPEVDANRNQIQIDFVGVRLGAGESLRYQYKLEGAERDWSALTEQRTVNYPSLSAGTYRFLVRAVSSDGTPSDSPAILSFRILSPVWRRWWFLAIAAMIFASVIFAFLHSRYQRLKVLRESETRFRMLAETASDAIITIDEQSRIVMVNHSAERVFGYTMAEMIGADPDTLMPEHRRHLDRDGLGSRRDSRVSIELRGVHKDQREIPLEVSFGEFTREGKRYFTAIARDITERRRAEEALTKSREERLAELDRVRSRIATDLHDDIGSSLTQITILSEVAQQHTADGDRQSVDALTRIISVSNELVDAMSDIVWAINPKKDHLSDLVQRMRRFASDIFTARSIAFEFQAPNAANDIELGANMRREIFLVFKGECK